jgi:hypothetical protein
VRRGGAALSSPSRRLALDEALVWEQAQLFAGTAFKLLWMQLSDK